MLFSLGIEAIICDICMLVRFGASAIVVVSLLCCILMMFFVWSLWGRCLEKDRFKRGRDGRLLEKNRLTFLIGMEWSKETLEKFKGKINSF